MKMEGCSSTSVLGEANGERGLGDFILEKVLLVEEEDDGGVGEPSVVANVLKQLQALLHSILEVVWCGSEGRGVMWW